MGDHRASIKIDMEFHGVKDSCDMWINYSPDSSNYYGVDERILAFIRDVYERGMEAWEKELAKTLRQQQAAETEAKERAELNRLKRKYEKSPARPPTPDSQS